MPNDLNMDELQNSLNLYYDHINASHTIPENRKRPLKVVKLNIGKPFYLAEEQLKDKEIEKMEKEIEDQKEIIRGWII